MVREEFPDTPGRSCAQQILVLETKLEVEFAEYHESRLGTPLLRLGQSLLLAGMHQVKYVHLAAGWPRRLGWMVYPIERLNWTLGVVLECRHTGQVGVAAHGRLDFLSTVSIKSLDEVKFLGDSP